MKERLEIDQVLEWLEQNHPELAKTAETDRNWVWLCCGESLRGKEPEKVAIRKSISDFGFRFAQNGHPMPSGNVGIWAHSCLVPKRFARSGSKSSSGGKSKQTKPANQVSNGKGRIDPFAVSQAYRDEPEPEPMDPALAEGMAFFNS